jgi:lipopolysaccharide export system permease protein
MRAAGVTVWNIAKGVIYSSIVLMIASFAIGAYLGPVMQHAADLRQALATSDQAVLMDASATWLKDDTSFTYIDKVLPNGELSGVVRYEVAHNELQRITSAKSANFIHNQWVLNDVDVTNFAAHHVQVTHYSQSQLTRLVPPSLLKVIVSTPDYLTLTGLWSFIQYQKQNGLDVSEYLLQFWSTIIQPVSILILMLMAVPFVFGPLRSVTMGLRLIAGLILGFVFFIVSEFFGPFSMLHNVPPFLGAAIPCALFAVVLYALMKRMP